MASFQGAQKFIDCRQKSELGCYLKLYNLVLIQIALTTSSDPKELYNMHLLVISLLFRSLSLSYLLFMHDVGQRTVLNLSERMLICVCFFFVRMII